MEGSQLVGKLLAGRYKLIKLIGQGGMGSVYQAHDQQMSNRVVAVKILAPHLIADEKQVMRFEQEARAANQLRHPNTISVLDFGNSEGHIYMVMELLIGETLTHVLRAGRPEALRSLYIVRQVLKSLAEAHSKGIVHRDLKPDNIFICDIYGEKDFVKVIDFGIAKFLESGGAELTQAGKMFGTPRYLSPEQAQGLPLSPASDLYSAGVILFEMLAGRPPFVAEDPIAVAIKHVQEAPPAFADVAPEVLLPEVLEDLVYRLLAKKAAQRFQSAEEVLEQIDLAMMELQGGRHPSGQFPAVALRTPGKPITVPPPSRRSQPMPTVEPEATRALDVRGGADEATMALDHSAVSVSAASNAATMALDTVDAKAMVAAATTSRGDSSSAAPSSAHAAAPATPAATAPAHRNLLVLLIVAVLVVGGAVAVLLNRDGTPAAQPEVPAQPADRAAGPPAVAAAQQASSPAASAPDQKAEVAALPTAASAATQAVQTGVGGAGVGGAGVGGVGAAGPAVGTAASERKMVVESTPPGALLVVDGKELGKTPLPLTLVEGGGKKVVLKRDGHENFEVDYATLHALAQVKPIYSVSLTASKSVMTKVAPKKPKKKEEKDW